VSRKRGEKGKKGDPVPISSPGERGKRDILLARLEGVQEERILSIRERVGERGKKKMVKNLRGKRKRGKFPSLGENRHLPNSPQRKRGGGLPQFTGKGGKGGGGFSLKNLGRREEEKSFERGKKKTTFKGEKRSNFKRKKEKRRSFSSGGGREKRGEGSCSTTFLFG